jgi:hypothetical protein
MPLTAGETPITPSDTGLNGKDGADCDAKPAQSVYEDLGWDFSEVWTMDGSTGYPVLRWQH